MWDDDDDDDDDDGGGVDDAVADGGDQQVPGEDAAFRWQGQSCIPGMGESRHWWSPDLT